MDAALTAIPLLSVANLCLNIGPERRLHDLSFSLHEGERVALLGASGCGKSLTANVITGIQPVNSRLSGSLRVAGEEVLGLFPTRRPMATRVAALFQETGSALNPLVTIGKQLLMALRHHPDAKSQAVRLLVEVEFDDPPAVMRRYPSQLSGGQRQRVCLALALAGERRLVVADEPTTALDVSTQHRILSLLRRLSEAPHRPALLFITHDLVLASQLCHRALIMAEGRIVERGEIAQLLAAPQHPSTQALVGAARRAADVLAGAS